MVRKKQTTRKLMTELELELMNALWSRGEGAVKEIQDSLPATRPLAYTSVATMMKILEKKGFVGSRKLDRAYTYYPLVSREEYESTSVEHLVNNVFSGAASSLAKRLLSESDFSESELKSLRALLNERLKS